MTLEVETFQKWREHVRDALDGMLYISESEAPLVLLDAAPVADLAEVQKFIRSEGGTGMQVIVSAQSFLNEIHHSADPNDSIIQENTARFDKLFEILDEEHSSIQVIRVNDLIYISAIRAEGSLLIRTETVET